MSYDNNFKRIALIASDVERAQAAYLKLINSQPWSSIDEADAVIVLGGDGFMLQTLHAMMDENR